MRHVLLLSVAASLLACSGNISELDCTSNDDCALGLVCIAGECKRSQEPDASDAADAVETADTDAADPDVADDTGDTPDTPTEVGVDTGVDTDDASADADAAMDTDATIDAAPTDAGFDALDAGDTADVSDADTSADTPDTSVPDAADAADVAPDAPERIECSTTPFDGQLVSGSDVPNGGIPRRVSTVDDVAYPDANLDALFALPVPGADAEVDVDVVLSGVTVVATSFYSATPVSPSQGVFWIADANGAMGVYLDRTTAATVPPFTLRTGQRITMRVTRIGSFRGATQIRAATAFALDASDRDVYLLELPLAGLQDAPAGQMVDVTGTITANLGACGGSSTCWTVNDGTATATLRTAFADIALGDCLKYVGPTTPFGDELQLDATNFSWMLLD